MAERGIGTDGRSKKTQQVQRYILKEEKEEKEEKKEKYRVSQKQCNIRNVAHFVVYRYFYTLTDKTKDFIL